MILQSNNRKTTTVELKNVLSFMLINKKTRIVYHEIHI